MDKCNPQYKTKSAVLFIIFKRLTETAAVFEKIREAQPTRLYIGAARPRADKEGEDELCRQTREIALKVDWDCESIWFSAINSLLKINICQE